MVYKPGYLRERSKQLINARKWGITIATGLVGAGLLISELQRMSEAPLSLMNYGYIALFLMTGTLIFSWIWSTQKELDLLFEWLDPERYEPPSSFVETVLIFGLALLLVGLLFASRNPFAYSLIFTTYSLVDSLAGKRLNAELSAAFEKSKERAHADLQDDKLAAKARLYLRGLGFLEHYFLGRRHGLRLRLSLASSLVGLVISMGWLATHNVLLGFSAYVILFVVLLTSLATIWHWRITRDTQLRPVAADLNELNRQDSPTHA